MLRTQCIELLTEIEARLDFDDEMPPLNLETIMEKVHAMAQEVETALETANYDKLLQSGIQVNFLRVVESVCFLAQEMRVFVNTFCCLLKKLADSNCWPS